MATGRNALGKRIGILALTLATVIGTAGPGYSQNFFERLFGGGIRSNDEYRRDRQRQNMGGEEMMGGASAAKPKPKPITKIAAPAYYTYRADPLVQVALPKAAPAADAQPALVLDGARFDEAMAAVADLSLTAEKEVADAIARHYAAEPRFIWVAGYGLNGRAEQALRVLGEAAGHGLDASDYSVAVPPKSFSMDDMSARQAELARFELELSVRVLRYARDAVRGRIDPNKLSGYHDFAPKQFDLSAELGKLSKTQDVAILLNSYHPQSAEYQALRVELEALQASAENDIVVDPKLLLKPGQTSAELPKIIALIERQAAPEFATKHAILLALSRNSETYSQDLVPFIKEAQEAAGLKGDGVIGPRTVQTFAGVSKADRIRKVEVALEQMRWLPSELGAKRVFINQPAFTAAYFENGQEKLSMRTVIGSVSNQTTFFQDVIQRVEYNPYWGVPQSIIVNEMLPRLQRDPGYLDRAGYEVTDSKGKRIPSSAINWGAYGSKVPFNVRQSPSEANALGELKILFPNKHAIYMHDTPQKALFSRDSRALSHGCIRLAQPREMAAALLGKDVDYIKGKLANGHSGESIPGDIPVYVAYFTAWPDSAGKVEYFNDVYSRDERVMMAIEATEAVRTPAS
ncbi:MAG: L,D-transpeptidase family protein [Mesorhizobium sp.]